MKQIGFNYDAVRFILAGAVNTGLSYVVYWTLLHWMNYQLAYILSWIFGLVLVIVLYPSKVFVGSQNSWKKRLLVALQYLFVFCVGIGLLGVFVKHLQFSPAWAAIVVMGITTVLNFLLMRLLYRYKSFSNL